jgi:hypothetical protein
MGAMASGEWESLVGLVIAPGLEEAAAELNGRPGIVAEVSEHPFDDACVLWIGRREPASAFVAPHGAFAIHDEPVLPMIRVEEADPRISSGRPVVSVYLRRAELSIASIKELALAFRPLAGGRVAGVGSRGAGRIRRFGGNRGSRSAIRAACFGGSVCRRGQLRPRPSVARSPGIGRRNRRGASD